MNVPVKTFYYFLCHALKARDGEEKEEEEKKEGRGGGGGGGRFVGRVSTARRARKRKEQGEREGGEAYNAQGRGRARERSFIDNHPYWRFWMIKN